MLIKYWCDQLKLFHEGACFDGISDGSMFFFHYFFLQFFENLFFESGPFFFYVQPLSLSRLIGRTL